MLVIVVPEFILFFFKNIKISIFYFVNQNAEVLPWWWCDIVNKMALIFQKFGSLLVFLWSPVVGELLFTA
jgi:hypothetical protein